MPRVGFIPPMEARLVTELPVDNGWQFEPKWDGFRCVAVKDDGKVDLWAKSGKPLGRYFPEIEALVEQSPAKRLILDGELVVPIAGTASFDALQQRLHPARSRVLKLAAQTPALLVVFDLLHDDGTAWYKRPLAERRPVLQALADTFRGQAGFRLSPISRDIDQARRWFAELSKDLDGVIAKRLDQPYLCGERAMLKIKRVRTADCVVGGFRYRTGSNEVGSLLLGLFNDLGELHHVGFTSGLATSQKPELTKKLEALRGKPGFTGKAPGGPSRWSNERSASWEPLRHELVVEVQYDQITGNRFRHGTRLVRWRPDKAPLQCTFAQLARPVDPDAIIKAVVASKQVRRRLPD